MEHGWFESFRDLQAEYEGVPCEVSGRLPASLKGTLFRVGVGQYTAFGKRLPHWFDGDGAVLRVELTGEGARATAKLVRSEGGREEHDAGHHFLGSYGLAPQGLWRRVLSIFNNTYYRNAANTSVLYWNDRLFALWEGGPPTELNPLTLQTLGPATLGGAIKGAFSAHPHHVLADGSIVNFGVRNVPPHFRIYRLNSTGIVTSWKSASTGGRGFLHDFWVTPRHIILALPPVFVDPVKMILKGKTIAESLIWKPEAGTLFVVEPREGEGKRRTFKMEPFLPLHFTNAFDDGDGVVADVVGVHDMKPVDDLGTMAKGYRDKVRDGFLHRIEMKGQGGQARVRRICDAIFDVPRLAPSDVGNDYRYAFGGSMDPEVGEEEFFDALLRIDVKSGEKAILRFGANRYPSEPILIPDENGGHHVLTLVFDAQARKSELQLFDAKSWGAPPIAAIRLPHPFPLTFHGSWVPRGARTELPH